MPVDSQGSDAKRIKLDFTEVNEVSALSISNNSNLDDLLGSPSDTCENTSIISAFDHDSSSILSGSIYESSCEVLSSDICPKGILKSLEFVCKNTEKNGNSIQFHEIEIFYFNRQQSFCSVPSLGGSALGMEMQHFSSEKLIFNKDVDSCRNRKKIDSNSWEKISKYSKEDYSILQPIVAKHRRILLKNSGTSRIETVDKEVCDLIRSSRERCGCQCIGGQCLPDTCSCALNGIQCQVDRGNFPCCCGPNPCANPQGRVEFNPIRVRTHFIHTMMRLQMQDQYQCDEPKELSKNVKYSEKGEVESKAAKESDINMCNSTDQGSCRDCQNDKYLHVLMNEWTHQLQKLHTSKHYSSSVSIPYNSWTYIPEAFCSTTYCDKDIPIFPVLPYSHYTVSNLPTLNFGIHQVNYPNSVSELQYRPNTSPYSEESAEEMFNVRANLLNFSVSGEAHEPINDVKHQMQMSFPSKPNSSTDTVKTNNEITCSTYPIFPAEKSYIYSRNPYEKGSAYICKYSAHFSSRQSDLKELGYPSSAYVNTVPYSPVRESSEESLNEHCEELSLIRERPSIVWDEYSHHNKVTHASNGQLYTVLQPVSESGIVSNFYQNSQESDCCKICKYKSTDSRQRISHLCISDFSMATGIYSSHQMPIECSDKSEVCA